HRPISQRVVARRARDDESYSLVAFAKLLYHREATASRVLRDPPRVIGGVGILVDVAPALVAEDPQLVEVRTLVHARELSPRCYARSGELEIAAKAQLGHAIHDRTRAVGPFRVALLFVARVVMELVDDQHHGL